MDALPPSSDSSISDTETGSLPMINSTTYPDMHSDMSAFPSTNVLGGLEASDSEEYEADNTDDTMMHNSAFGFSNQHVTAAELEQSVVSSSSTPVVAPNTPSLQVVDNPASHITSTTTVSSTEVTVTTTTVDSSAVAAPAPASTPAPASASAPVSAPQTSIVASTIKPHPPIPTAFYRYRHLESADTRSAIPQYDMVMTRAQALEKCRKLPKGYRLVPTDSTSPYFSTFARGGRDDDGVSVAESVASGSFASPLNASGLRSSRLSRVIKSSMSEQEIELDDTMKKCVTLLGTIMGLRDCHIFHMPVDPVRDQVPNYFNIVENPMDLGTVKEKLTRGNYSSHEDFASDVRLTFTNAMTFNPVGNWVHELAKKALGTFNNKFFDIQEFHIHRGNKAKNAKKGKINLMGSSSATMGFPGAMSKKRRDDDSVSSRSGKRRKSNDDSDDTISDGGSECGSTMSGSINRRKKSKHDANNMNPMQNMASMMASMQGMQGMQNMQGMPGMQGMQGMPNMEMMMKMMPMNPMMNPMMMNMLMMQMMNPNGFPAQTPTGASSTSSMSSNKRSSKKKIEEKPRKKDTMSHHDMSAMNHHYQPQVEQTPQEIEELTKELNQLNQVHYPVVLDILKDNGHELPIDENGNVDLDFQRMPPRAFAQVRAFVQDQLQKDLRATQQQ